MGACKHTSWLNFTCARERILWDTSRLFRLLPELIDPAHQQPSLLLFVGRKAKEATLRDLYSLNEFKRSRNGVATLTADRLSAQSDFPIFVAESDPQLGDTPQTAVSVQCHETSPLLVRWALPEAHSLYNVVHARLFCLFADVVCIFADDFGDFEDVVSLLRAWAALGRASIQFSLARPKIIIVKQGAGPGPSPTYDLLQSEHLHHTLSQADVLGFYSSITVLHLVDEPARLKELIQRQTAEMRHIKQSLGCSFSALHLSCFFGEAAKHTARTITEPFDFLTSSRVTNPIPTEYSEHLSEFLRLCVEHKISLRIQTTYIASTILLDAYPPGMHRELALVTHVEIDC